MQNRFTAVIILNYNNYEDTINCIESVEKYNTSLVKIIVVDNGSTRDGVKNELAEYFQNHYGDKYLKVHDNSSISELKYITFVVSPINDGYACGNNKGLRYAVSDPQVDRILVLNNDVLFVEDIIGKLIKYQDNLPKCAIISPVLYKKNMKEYDLNCARLNHKNWEIILVNLFNYRNIFNVVKRSEKRRYLLLSGNRHHSSLMEVELPSGSCMMFRKSLMNEIKIFDPNTFLYFEENILYKQIEKKGLKNYVALDLKCVHLGASTISKSSSTYIARIGINSIDYYFNQYSNLSSPQRIVWNITKKMISLKLKIKDLIK